MSSSLSITSAVPDPALLDLPWDLPLETWPDETIAALPKGISRHLVRFVHLEGYIVAVKETTAELARREYELLRTLQRLEVPCVEPFAVVTGRIADDGEELAPALVTRHLKFSLPYRALYSQALRPDTATRLVDALALLLARLHLVGFYWGDVSLSNTLFRRDAETFAAFLVDAETGDLHRELSPGQRSYDVDLARTNIIGELMDLAAGELLDEDVDEVAIGDALVARYEELWAALTTSESFDANERWRVAARIEHLNNLGFDVDELAITTDIDGTTVQIQPKVVDAGHHSRRLLRLTGLDVQENQARRLLNDLDSFRAAAERQNDDEEFQLDRRFELPDDRTFLFSGGLTVAGADVDAVNAARLGVRECETVAVLDGFPLEARIVSTREELARNVLRVEGCQAVPLSAGALRARTPSMTAAPSESPSARRARAR